MGWHAQLAGDFCLRKSSMQAQSDALRRPPSLVRERTPSLG
jgi:hypothetical protein